MFIKERINLSKERGNTLIANNKKAFHDYFIEEKFEAGIELVGTEVKSIRQGHCSIKEAFVGIDHGEVYVYRMNVNPYERGNIFNKDPLRTRKLLLHRYEINKLIGQQKVKGYTIMPPAHALIPFTFHEISFFINLYTILSFHYYLGKIMFYFNMSPVGSMRTFTL